MSEWWLFGAKWASFMLFHVEKKNISMRWWCPHCTRPTQHASLEFYSASTLKQQSAGRHVAPIGHIIMILSQAILVLTPEYYVIKPEVANT